MRHVEVGALPLDQLAGLLSPERQERLRATADRARGLLGERVVWNVNATAQGGGVAEMLQSLLAYVHGAGIDTRWSVLRGDPEFFAVTKRLHNVLHGEPGDGGPLGDAEHEVYERVLAANLEAVVDEIDPDDIVLLHDPQTAGLVQGLKAAGAHVAWRCHIGRDEQNDLTRAGWGFLRPYLEPADAFVFSRREYVPDWVPQDRVWVIPPSIDPFSAKNQDLPREQVESVLVQVGLARDGVPRPAVTFARRDGRTDELRRHSGLVVTGTEPPPLSARTILQVSRWDRLKDMSGVLTGFAQHLEEIPSDVHLMLAGPDVTGVTDDPEGAQVLAECTEQWKQLPRATRDRVHLAALPMDDVDANALMVNALQRHAYAVVQKSLVEGFGLTVTEAMWKGRPVLASAVGGIRDQIRDGVDGLLVHDPHDLEEFASALDRLIADPDLAEKLGTAGRQRIEHAFLGDRHLAQYVDLFAAVIE